MHALIKAAAIAGLALSVRQSPPLHASAWTLDGRGQSAYEMHTDGLPTDPNGATVSLQSLASPPPRSLAAAVSTIAADALRQRRITISGELQTRSAADGASLYLRVERGTKASIIDNGGDQVVRGVADWTRRSIALPVPADATAVVVGILLRGEGTVTARDVHVEVSAPLAATGALPQPVQDVLEAAIAIAKQHSVRRNEIAWGTLEPEVRAFAAGAEKTSDVYPAIRHLLSELGDHHSFLLPPAQTSALMTGGRNNPAPDVHSLPDGAGYISVPSYSGVDSGAMRAYAARTHESIGATMTLAPCGWVVDLRSNTGGNMWPMLAGLKPFLGSAGLGTFERPDGSSPKWVAGDHVGVEPPAALASLERAWVAVLTGPRTASSGEAVAIAFRGRPRTRSFGQPTAGLSTANGEYPLPDGAMMFLTDAVEADRTGRRYGDKIEPEERMEADSNTVDVTLLAATRWLKQSSGCGKSEME